MPALPKHRMAVKDVLEALELSYAPAEARALLAEAAEARSLSFDDDALTAAQVETLTAWLHARGGARRTVQRLERRLAAVGVESALRGADAATQADKTTAALTPAPPEAEARTPAPSLPSEAVPTPHPAASVGQVSPGSAPLEARAPSDTSPGPAEATSRRRTRSWMPLLAVGAVGLVAAGLWWGRTRVDSTPEAASPSDAATAEPSPPTPDPEPSPPPEVPSGSAPTAFEADLARLPRALLDGTPLWEVDPTWVRLVDAETFAAKRAGWIAHHVRPARIQGEGRALKAMGLLPAEFDYVAWMQQQMDGGVVQYFDDDDGVVYRLDPLPEGSAAPPPLREVVVLLQYRHFGLAQQLDERDLGPSGDDRGLARMALLSGHAMATYVDVELGPGTFLSDRGLQVLGDTEEAADESDELAAVPDFLRQLLLFPEFEGARYVHDRLVAAAHGHQDDIFTRLPRSTQEIMHPDHDPVADPVVKVTARLPHSWLETEGTEPEYEAVLGEFALGEWLELVGKRDDRDELIAAWDGHRMWSIPRDKKVLLVHVTVWDDEAAATRIAEAVDGLFTQRYGPDKRRRAAVAQRGRIVAWLEGALPSKGKAPTALEHLLDSVVLE